MNYDPDMAAEDFLELSSSLRLGIIFKLFEKRSTLSVVAKELNTSVPEAHRNFERLAKADLIVKDGDGNYRLTTYGKIICSQIPSLVFVSQNRKYFRHHDIKGIPEKFIQRVGALQNGKHISGFVKVLDCWKDIYNNSGEYIFNILSEVPYTVDLMKPLAEKIKKGGQLRSIFSESAVIPKGRKKAVEDFGFKKFIEEGLIERKMKNDVSVLVVLNEKEACVMFPTIEGEPDLSEAFYSSEFLFHEWCKDYFNYCWDTSRTFQENKLSE